MQTDLQRPQPLFAQIVRYEIPPFQRHYVWKQDEQWEPFWEDVESLAQAIIEGQDPDAHFLGAIVLQQLMVPAATIERRIVVDGQQRLTTLQLLLDAIQEVFEKRNHTKLAEMLAVLVLNPEAFLGDDRDSALKVWPTISDRDAFRHAMSNDLSIDNYPDQEHSIIEAHEFFKGKVEHWLDGFEVARQATAAEALSQVVRDRLELVVINLGASDDPHVIFETLNARGTPLLQSDMVKNYIYYDANIVSRDDNTVPESIWPFDSDSWWSEQVGRGMQQRPRVDIYLNHWLTLRNQTEMKSHDEFTAFRKYAKGRIAMGESTLAVARDLADLGSIYQDVEQVRRGDIETFLQRRNLMNLGVVTPLILWLLSSSLRDETLQVCFTALESFLVRRGICGYGARGYGGLFASLIARLDRSPVNDADRVLVRYLRDQTAPASLWPGDAELRDRFRTAQLFQWLTRGRVRMLLEAFEEEMRGANYTEGVAVPQNLPIEHVMPQAWRTHWPLPSGSGEVEEEERRSKMIHTIGNLTLVNKRLNSKLSNDPWEFKKATLAQHSTLFLNKELTQRGPDVWDEATIEKRSDSFHKMAVKIWPHADDISLGGAGT